MNFYIKDHETSELYKFQGSVFLKFQKVSEQLFTSFYQLLSDFYLCIILAYLFENRNAQITLIKVEIFISNFGELDDHAYQFFRVF